MKHQHIRSPHVNGEIHCYDALSMNTALYDTVIDSSGHKAIVTSPASRKYPVGYLVINGTDQNGNDIELTVTDFRVETVNVTGIEVGKEAMFIIKFSADLIDIGV